MCPFATARGHGSHPLVHRATQHRIDASQNHQPLRYQLRKTDGQREATKDIIETRDEDVARLVALNGQPLSAQANHAELDRLNTLANQPETQQHRCQREQKDEERGKIHFVYKFNNGKTRKYRQS
jgi:hypothetical protein